MCVKFCENRTKPVGVAIWNWLQTSIYLAGHRSPILVCSSGAKKTITLTDCSTQTGSPQGDELWYKSTPVRDSCSLHDIWKLRVTQYRKKTVQKFNTNFLDMTRTSEVTETQLATMFTTGWAAQTTAANIPWNFKWNIYKQFGRHRMPGNLYSSTPFTQFCNNFPEITELRNTQM